MAHILLVDDDADVRATLRTALERGGHRVAELPDGLDCLREIRRERPDVVILDILMPRQEGLETISELRREGVDIPVLAITGGGKLGVEPLLQTAAAMGACRTLAKPVMPAQLLDAVSACLETA